MEQQPPGLNVEASGGDDVVVLDGNDPVAQRRARRAKKKAGLAGEDTLDDASSEASFAEKSEMKSSGSRRRLKKKMPSEGGDIVSAPPPPVSGEENALNPSSIGGDGDSATVGTDDGKKLRKKKVLKKKKPKAPLLRTESEADAELLRATIKLQRAFRRRRFKVNVERVLILNRMNRHIRVELLATERTYVACLQKLKRDFIYPLSRILSEVEMQNVFPAVNEIWKLHEGVLQKLEDAAKDDLGRRSVAIIFSELAGCCSRVYSPFLNNFSQSSIVMKKLMENDQRIRLAVDSIQSNSSSGLKYLNELMITPMQRLPRYELLFKGKSIFGLLRFFLTLFKKKELVKCTSEVHPDFVPLKQALADIQATCKLVNESKRLSDEKQRRGFLEQHASMEVLRPHAFETRSIKTVKFCARCEKSVFSIGKKAQKCTECGEYYHTECAAEIGENKVCPQRRRLDLRSKELIDQMEVYLMPEDEMKLTGKSSAANRSGSKLALPGGLKSGGTASPSMRRLSNSPAVARKGSTARDAGVETEIRGLLFCFSDGLAIAHKWVFGGNDSDPVIDMLCEYPWKCVQARPVVSSDPSMHTFVVSSNAKGIASMKFYCKSALEQQAVLGKMESIRSEQMAIRELKSNDLKRGMSIPRSMLAASERFKKGNQREGGMGSGIGNDDDRSDEN